MKFFDSAQQIQLGSLSETQAFASTLAQEIRAVERAILILDGEMGAGKTQFCRYLMESLGVVETEVASPSFSIHNTYESAIGPIEHIDLYRLTSEDDLESTGFWDLFLEKPRLIVIEWGDRLREMGMLHALPKTWPRVQIEFQITGPSSRVISIRKL